MAQQTILEKEKTIRQEVGSLEYFIDIAEKLNSGKLVNNWTLPEIENLLRGWAIQFDPNLEKASFDQIITFLKSFSENETDSTTVPTAQVKQLVEELEEQEKTDQEIKQEKIQEANEKITKIYLKSQLQQKLTKTPIDEKDKSQIAQDILREIEDNLFESNLPVLLEKIDQSPDREEQWQQLNQQAQEEFDRIWTSSIDQIAQKNNLSLDQISYLKTLSFSALKTLDLTQTFSQTSQHQQIISETEKDLKEGQELPQKQKDENDYRRSQIEAKRQQQLTNIKDLFSPALSPQKAEIFTDQFLEFFPDNLASISSEKPSETEIEKATTATLLQLVGTETPLTASEIKAIIKTLVSTNRQNLDSFKLLSDFSEPSLGLLLDLKTEGKTVFEEIGQELSQNGINLIPETDKKLKTLRLELQATQLIFKGVTSQDLQNKIDQLLKSGVSNDSPQIRELKEILISYEKFLFQAKEAGFDQKQIIQWQNSIRFPVRLSFSNFRTILQKTGVSSKIKTSFLSPAKSWLSHTSLGKTFQLLTRKTASKTLQTLWSFGKEGLKKVASPVISKILTTILGISAKALLVGSTNVVGLLVIAGVKILGKAKKTLKNILTSGVRFLNSIFQGFFGINSVPESEDTKSLSKTLLYIFLLVFLFPLFFSIPIDQNVKKSSLTGGMGGEIDYEDYDLNEAELNCTSNPPLAEKTICLLSEAGSPPCNQHKINNHTIETVNTCFDQITLEGKESISLSFNLSVSSYHSLQCVGFVKGIQAARGMSIITNGNAKQYLDPPPPNYQSIAHKQDVEIGDLAIWTNSTYGHIAVVVGKNEELGRVRLAQAFGTNNSYGGTINVTETPITAPSGYIRFIGE